MIDNRILRSDFKPAGWLRHRHLQTIFPSLPWAWRQRLPLRREVLDLPDGDVTVLPVDLVDLFRAPDHISAHVDEILAMTPLPATVWMQLGISHGAAAARLRAAGIQVVQDRCIMVDHRRLLTESSE